MIVSALARRIYAEKTRSFVAGDDQAVSGSWRKNIPFLRFGSRKNTERFHAPGGGMVWNFSHAVLHHSRKAIVWKIPALDQEVFVPLDKKLSGESEGLDR